MPDDWYVGPGAPGSDAGTLDRNQRTQGALQADTGELGSLTITGVLTLGPNGKIVDSNGSSWTTSGITLAATGSAADALTFNRSGFSPDFVVNGFITSTLAQFALKAQSAAGSANRASTLSLIADSGSDAAQQALLFVTDSGGNVAARVELDGGTGAGAGIVALTGTLRYAVTTGGTSGALPNPGRFLTFQDAAGNTRYIPVFTAVNPWAI